MQENNTRQNESPVTSEEELSMRTQVEFQVFVRNLLNKYGPIAAKLEVGLLTVMYGLGSAMASASYGAIAEDTSKALSDKQKEELGMVAEALFDGFNDKLELLADPKRLAEIIASIEQQAR